MTRLPLESWGVVGLAGTEYPKYKVGPICSHPLCSRTADHSHHLWRRSFLAGDYPWVRLSEEQIVGNLVGLCWRHHNEITENKAMIKWDSLAFFWDGAGVTETALNPQPPLRVTRHGHVPEEHVHQDNDLCPTCHQRVRPKIERKREEAKPRGTWNVTVPKDARENGADVLDELLESARVSLDTAGISYGPERKVRYYVLSAALALFVTHASEILGDGVTPEEEA